MLDLQEQEHIKKISKLNQVFEEERARFLVEKKRDMEKQEIIFIQRLEVKYEEYQHTVNQLRIEINVLLEKLRAKEREIQEQLIQIQKYSSYTITIEQYKEEITRLKLENRNMKTTIVSLEETIAELRKKIFELEKQIIELKNQLS